MKHHFQYPSRLRGNILVVAMVTVAILSLIVGNVVWYTSRTAATGNRSQAYAETKIVATSLSELLFAQWQVAANRTYSLNPPVGTFSFISPDQFNNLTEGSALDQMLNPSENVSYRVTTFDVVGVGPNGTEVTDPDESPAAQGSSADSMSSASLVWYQGIVEVTREGRNPVSVRLGRILPMQWESLLNLAMAEFIYSPNAEQDELEFGEMSIFPGPQMDIIGRVYAKGNLFYGHDSLNFYDVTAKQGVNEDTVTTSGEASNEYPELREAKNGTPGSATYWESEGDEMVRGNEGDLVDDGVADKEVFMGDPEEVFSLSDNDPNNDGYRELIERPVGTDNPAIEQERFYNKSDVRILVDSSEPPYLLDSDGVISGPNPARVQVLVADYTSSSEDGFPSGETDVTPASSDPTTWSDTYATVWDSLGLATDPAEVDDLIGGSKIQDDREGGSTDSDAHNVFITNVDVNKLADGLAQHVTGYDSGGFNGGIYISDITADANYSAPPANDPQDQPGTRSPIVTYEPPDINPAGKVTKAGQFSTSSSTYDKGVRLQNGAVFPDSLRQPNNPAGGLTIVSDNGVYVQGDYNTGRKEKSDGSIEEPDSNRNRRVPDADDALTQNSDGSFGNNRYDDFTTTDDYDRRPAMVAGDALLVLSNAWEDGNSHLGKNSRKSKATTINAAIMAGNVKATDSTNYYDGGMENFPRFLEKWDGWKDKYFTYYGSMLLMFRSKYFNGSWRSADYGAPHRRWYYENRFLENSNYDSSSGRHSGTPPIYPRVSVEIRSGGFIDYSPEDS